METAEKQLGENAFTVALACYHWLQANHAGQSSPEYALLSRLQAVYRPSPREQFFEGMDDAAKMIYDMIESGDQCEVLLTQECVL